MVEEALSFWTEIQRFEDKLAEDPRSLSFAPLAELYRKLGLLDDAISVAAKGAALHPEYAGGFLALAYAYLDKGLKAEARPALERAVQLNPENLRAEKMLGELYAEIGEDALARKVLERVLAQDPDDSESLLLMRSIAAAPVREPEGAARHTGAPEAPGAGAEEPELLEEAEVIEDLTDLFEEPLEALEPLELLESDESDLSDWSDQSDLFEEPEAPEAHVAPEAPAADNAPAALVAPVAPQETAAAHSSRNPLSTATIAELYVSQGFVEKAIGIYHDLLLQDPDNHHYRLRCTELKAAQERHKEEDVPPAPVFPSAINAPHQEASPPEEVSAELSRWLENIRRNRDGV